MGSNPWPTWLRIDLALNRLAPHRSLQAIFAIIVIR